jgi:hypothetical protein
MRLGIRLPSDFLLDFQHSCFEVTIAEGITQIPAYAEKDDLGLVVSPLERAGFGPQQPPVVIELGPFTTIEDQMSGLFATEPYCEALSRISTQLSIIAPHQPL